MPLLFRSAVSAVLLVLSHLAYAQSIYGVSIDTTQLRGSSGKLVFNMTSNRPLTNRFDVINFYTDGITSLPLTQGEFIAGDLVQNSPRPAKFTRVKAYTFFTELALPFVAFGQRISFTINVSETAPLDGSPPDQFSLFLMPGPDTARDFSPIVAVAISGERGGKLEMLTPRGKLKEFPLGAQRKLQGAVVGDDADHDDATDEKPGPGEAFPRLTQNLRYPPIKVTVTPAWTPHDPNPQPTAQTFRGTLTEFCGRRCAGETICTGGRFGIEVDQNTFYAFDDVGNLKAQVALVDEGQNPLRVGQFGSVEVVGNVVDTTLTVHSISLR